MLKSLQTDQFNQFLHPAANLGVFQGKVAGNIFLHRKPGEQARLLKNKSLLNAGPLDGLPVQ
ncbi:hypothetical protein D3C87_2137060 [compost metagenome]